MRAGAAALWIAAALAACAPDDVERCEIGSQTAALSAADRKIVGAAHDYTPDGTLRGREAELAASHQARRAAAWKTVAKVLASVALAEPLPSAPGAQIPAWQTWYGRDDARRLFQRLFEGLDPAERSARARFTDDALDRAFGWNVHAVEEMSSWPDERWREYLASFDGPEEIAGLGGVGRVAYSPSAARHLLASYPEILECLAGGVPAPFVDGPAEKTRRMVREPIALAGCQTRSLGPYFVASGETLRAVLDAGGGGLAVRSREGVTLCEGGASQPCQVSGAGIFYVDVHAGSGEIAGVVTIDYRQPDVPWAACVDGAFGLDAVVVKAAWHRAELGFQLPVHDTSAAALSSLLAQADPTWSSDRTADPGADEIYTMSLPNGSRYRLAGLHIMTKELDHWSWITLWWSDDPDRDFGADRPESVRQLGPPWSNYKMCAVTSFSEGDPDPEGGFSDSAPTLARALAATGAAGGPTWCSNPYLEDGPGNAATNCIGCHQHGGTHLTPEHILSDPAAFPHHGRTLLRNNFPADYSYALTTGDRLGPMFRDVVEYYELE